MALPTILTLALLATSISEISCRYVSNLVEYPVGTITEMSYQGKVVYKKFTCPAIYGRYPHPENCEYFYECRFGWSTLMHCNRGYLYDREHEQCRDRRTVKCHIGRERDHNHRDDKDKEIEVKEDIGYFRCPYIWGTFAHPYDCSKYFVCLHNYPKLFQCYKGFLYHESYRKCLPQKKVSCGKRLNPDQMRTSRKPVLTTTVKPVETTRAEITVTTKNHNFYCPFPYGRYPDPEDCSRYYECRFSIPYLYICPQSTLYDERKEHCMDEKRVKCGGRPGGNDEGYEPDNDKNVNFRCPYIWGTFAHPVDCSKYIICIYNVPSIFSCRKNELFDTRYRRCFRKEKVSCDDRINPDDPFPPGKTSTLTPTTMKKIPESTASSPQPTTTTPKPTTTTTTTTSVPTTTTTTSAPTTTTTTAVPTTTTTTAVPTTTTTTAVSTTTTTTSAPTTTTTTTTSAPTTTTKKPTTTTTPRRPTTTSAPTTTVSPETTSYTIPEFPTDFPVTKPNTPPPTDCNDNDLDCIIDETGDVTGWFDCPKRYGHYPHGSSRQLFIHCDNWRPFVKKCADETYFSPEYLVCVWTNKNKGI